MIEVRKEYLIDADVAYTYNFISDPENDTRWMSSVVGVTMKTTDTYDITMKFFGKKMVFGILTDTTANKRHEYKTYSGPLSFAGSYDFSPWAHRTKVIWTFKAEPGKFFGLVPTVLLKSALEKQADKDIAALQGLVKLMTSGAS